MLSAFIHVFCLTYRFDVRSSCAFCTSSSSDLCFTDNAFVSGSFDLEGSVGPRWKSQIVYKVEAEVMEAENTKVQGSGQS